MTEAATPRLLVVVGLPGSGKTVYLDRLKADGTVQTAFDDFHANAADNSCDVTASRWWRPLIESLTEGMDCAVADIAFCSPERRDALIEEVRRPLPGAKVVFHCFRADSDRCVRNLIARDRPSVQEDLQELQRWLPRYVIPDGATIIEVPEAGTGPSLKR
jgi:hypothetical protein